MPLHDCRLLVPEDDEFLAALGADPDDSEGEGAARYPRLPASERDVVVVTYDVPGRTRWIREDSMIPHLFGEGATRVSLWPQSPETHLVVRFDTESPTGELAFQVLPTVCVRDGLLFVWTSDVSGA